jgi:membrane-associated phospholipid phosphatase
LWRFCWYLLALHYVVQPLFYLYPLEPPWMHHPDIPRVQDLVFERTSGRDANPYAAMPSLHASMPFAAALWYGLRSAWGRVLLAYTALICLTVVYTGDHYVADLAAGLALAGAYFTGVRLLRLPVLRVTRLRVLAAPPQRRPRTMPRAA